MASTPESRQKNAIAALESAARLYQGKDGTAQVYPKYILLTADKFYAWLEDKG